MANEESKPVTATGLLKGKKGLILGLANERSIAWGITQACIAQGATLGFTYPNEAMEKRVRPLAEQVGSELVAKCDVQSDAEVDACFEEVSKKWGSLDFVVHSVAFANGDDLKGAFADTSRAGFTLAMDVSAYSLIAVAKRAAPLMSKGGSIITLSYYGAEKVVPNYRVMGVAKAALEACVRELAVDLGPKDIRVNAISAGPIKTLAASGISDFKSLLGNFETRAPLKRLTTTEDVGNSAAFLLSDLSGAVTGETLYVDCGFNITAM
jgi:enoyl-[acyl-carrier protein] reductase I